VQDRQADFRRQAGGSAASFFVGTGDLVGASPPPSAEYRDEPTIEVLNTMGMDLAVVGDDEFNLGTTELLRMSGATDGSGADDVGACQGVEQGVTGCFGEGEHTFTGAQFPYLAANVVSRATGEPILPPYQIRHTPLGQRVGFIGVVTEGTPSEVPPDGITVDAFLDGITDVAFLDEAEVVNQYVGELRSEGVQAIVVLLHRGGKVNGPTAADPSGCDGLNGAVTTVNERIDPAVDVILTGHSHAAYVCTLPVPGGPPRLVTQAGFYGRLVTDVRLTLDPVTGDVDRGATYEAVNLPVLRTDADPQVQAVVDYWTSGPGEESEADPVLQSTGSSTPTEDRALLIGTGALIVALVLPLGAWLSRRRRSRS
jgi:5'-nucleotidase